MEQTKKQENQQLFSAKRPESIQSMFSSIASRYDLMNSLLSFGIHASWKKKLVQASGVNDPKRRGLRILDCATGTGDLAFFFEHQAHEPAAIVGSDFCEPMLAIARQKALKHHSKVRFEQGDVTQLPYESKLFDVASISFGIRNVSDPSGGLSELARVVRPAGKVLILEFGQPRSRLLKKLFTLYSNFFISKLAGLISGQPQAYRYLQDSSALFPCGQDFLNLALATGRFSSTQFLPLQGGIAYLYCLTVKP